MIPQAFFAFRFFGRARPRDRRLPQHLHLAPESLGFALDCAAQAVGAVRLGAALPAALQTVFAAAAEGSAAAARGAMQDIRVSHDASSRDALSALIAQARQASAAAARRSNVLACALALLIDDEASAAYTPFTVVDQAVSAISRSP